jgi:hypothetical protein
MGKVGSTTVHRALKNCGLGVPIYHIHNLTKNDLNNGEKIFKELFPQQIPHVVWQGQYLRNRLMQGLKGKKWKIITLVRDPIARNISVFFQWPNMIITELNGKYNISSKIYNYNVEIKKEQIDILIRIFLDKVKHELPLTYFYSQFLEMLGIDIYSETFPKSLGYKIYYRGQIEILLVRLENLNTVAREAFKEFLGIENLVIKASNIGTHKKDFGSLYRVFKERIKLPVPYIEMMYNSQYAQHFYTQAEIHNFKRRWMS